jgi:hypothetical protein
MSSCNIGNIFPQEKGEAYIHQVAEHKASELAEGVAFYTPYISAIAKKSLEILGFNSFGISAIQNYFSCKESVSEPSMQTRQPVIENRVSFLPMPLKVILDQNWKLAFFYHQQGRNTKVCLEKLEEKPGMTIKIKLESHGNTFSHAITNILQAFEGIIITRALLGSGSVKSVKSEWKAYNITTEQYYYKPPSPTQPIAQSGLDDLLEKGYVVSLKKSQQAYTIRFKHPQLEEFQFSLDGEELNCKHTPSPWQTLSAPETPYRRHPLSQSLP